MTSLNPHQDAAAAAIVQLEHHLAELAAQGPREARHARCVRSVITGVVHAMAAERDAGANNWEIFEALEQALGNAMVSVCSTIAGNPHSPLAHMASVRLLASLTRYANETLGPGGKPSTMVSAEARTGYA